MEFLLKEIKKLNVQLKSGNFWWEHGCRKVGKSGNPVCIRTHATFKPLDFRGLADLALNDTIYCQFVTKPQEEVDISVSLSVFSAYFPAVNNIWFFYLNTILKWPYFVIISLSIFFFFANVLSTNMTSLHYSTYQNVHCLSIFNRLLQFCFDSLSFTFR